MPRVLIADDEVSVRSLVARAIAMDGHETVTAEDGAEAGRDLDLLGSRDPELLLEVRDARPPPAGVVDPQPAREPVRSGVGDGDEQRVRDRERHGPGVVNRCASPITAVRCPTAASNTALPCSVGRVPQRVASAETICSPRPPMGTGVVRRAGSVTLWSWTSTRTPSARRRMSRSMLVSPPRYRGVTVVARVIARPRLDPSRVRADALTALYGYLNPISGGRYGKGWEFGRPVQAGDVYALLQRVRGVDLVEDVRLFGANPVTGERGEEAQRLDVDPHSLIFSFEHHVKVEDH